MLAVMILLGLGFLFFIVHTIRCYLNKPKADEDDNEFALKYQSGYTNPAVRPI